MFSAKLFKRISDRNFRLIRFKHKEKHWSVQKSKLTPIQKAFEHYDDFYKQVFTTNWGSIRNGLTSKQKYVAVINNYSDNNETKTELENNGALNLRVLFNLEKSYIRDSLGKHKRQKDLERIWKMDKTMEVDSTQVSETTENIAENERKDFSLETSLLNAQYDMTRLINQKNALSTSVLYEFVPATKIKGMEDFIPESTHYKYYDNSEFPVRIEREYDFNFPAHLDVYTYEQSNHTDFMAPKKGSTGVFNYYLMDGGSVLPILALDIKPGHRILDMCAAPGGKSILALQTLYPSYLLSNDITSSRVDRIYKVFKQFLYDFNEKWVQNKKIRISNSDARILSEDNFDRVIVDVPCTTDRHSLKENDNNIFHSKRIKERLKLPELQSEILVNALKLVKIGGVVVYSTCSLSPIQNDGVVHMALRKSFEEERIEMIVKDLSPALIQTRSFYKLAEQKLMKYGHLVVPYVPLNFGPTYFCKLQRIK